MPNQNPDWKSKGFAAPPERRVAGVGGLLIYRCWGGNSSEWGTGYFSLQKPGSVIEAEMRFNIVDWGNGVHFVSTFRLKEGFPYWVGPVGHGPNDLSLGGAQAFVEGPIQVKIELMKSKEVLKHNAFVSSRIGNA
jgi:hypothetical protein